MVKFDTVSPPLSELPQRVRDRYVNEAVPFRTTTDGHRCLTDLQLAESPHLAALVRRFRNSFSYSPLERVWWFLPAPTYREPG